MRESEVSGTGEKMDLETLKQQLSETSLRLTRDLEHSLASVQVASELQSTNARKLLCVRGAILEGRVRASLDPSFTSLAEKGRSLSFNVQGVRVRETDEALKRQKIASCMLLRCHSSFALRMQSHQRAICKARIT